MTLIFVQEPQKSSMTCGSQLVHTLVVIPRLGERGSGFTTATKQVFRLN